MKLFRLNWVSVLLGAFLLFACSSSREALAPGERVVLGLLLDTTDGGPWGREGAVLVEKAKAAGFEVLVRTASGGGREIQKGQVRELIEAGADLLVVIPSASESFDPSPARDQPLSIPVIAFGELIPGIDPVLFVGLDLEAAGYLQARTVRERMAGGGVILLGGPEDDPCADRLREGQLKAFAEWEKTREEETEIVADLRLDPPRAGSARLLTAELLGRPDRAKDEVGAILAFDDEVAAGAAAAVEVKKLSGEVPVAGRGASLPACRRIIEGSQLLTIYFPPEALARAAVRSAIRLFRGMVPGEIANSLGFEDRRLEQNGGEVPAVLLPPVAVTRATMIETVILDGLYPIEAVYGSGPDAPPPASPAD